MQENWRTQLLFPTLYFQRDLFLSHLTIRRRLFKAYLKGISFYQEALQLDSKCLVEIIDNYLNLMSFSPHIAETIISSIDAFNNKFNISRLKSYNENYS